MKDQCGLLDVEYGTFHTSRAVYDIKASIVILFAKGVRVWTPGSFVTYHEFGQASLEIAFLRPLMLLLLI